MERFTKNEILFLKKYSSIYGGIQCSKVLNRSEHSIYSKCSKLNLEVKTIENLTEFEIKKLQTQFSKSKLSLNFSSNPKELSYFLGYFWADGYIFKNSLRLEITREDADNLKPILNKLGYFTETSRVRLNRKEQVCYQYSNKDIANTFKLLGKYPNSIESHEKILKFIPKKYHIWFLRGLIDGDGCIYINESNPSMIQFSISNSYNFDWTYLYNYLISNFNCKCKIIKRSCRNGTNLSSVIRCCGKNNVSNLLKELYKEDDGLYLKRKYNKILKILEYAKNEQTI